MYRDWRAHKCCGWHIGEVLVAILALSVLEITRRYIVVRVSLHQSLGGGTTVQLPFLALVSWQLSEKEDDDDKGKDSNSG